MSLNGQHSVKIGDSIRKKQKSNLMTFRYDFLPGSVATNKPGDVKIEQDHNVSVKLPNLPGSNPDHTLYKGTFKEAMKECVLIVDRIVFFIASSIHLFHDCHADGADDAGKNRLQRKSQKLPSSRERIDEHCHK